MLRIFIFILLLPFILSCSSFWENRNFVDPGYQAKFTYSSPLESKYAIDGEFQVDCHQQADTAECIKTFSTWYPEEMKSSDRTWPLVVLANGTGVIESKYEPIFSHLASWGFIVAGNEDENSLTGISTDKTLEHVLSMNEDPQSIFYHKVDTTAIGLAGHSQGAMAVVVTLNYYENARRYKAICLQSGGVVEGAPAIKVPVLMMAGTGKADSEWLCPLSGLEGHFDAIENVPVVMGRIKDVDHGDVLMRGDAYLTAWMCYWLQGDEAAGQCFFGNAPEIQSNAFWQDVRFKNVP